MIKHLVFDIGNVLVTFQPERYFINYFSTEEETKKICGKIFSNPLWLAYDQGLYSIEDLHKEYLKIYPDMKQELELVLSNWVKLLNPMEKSIRFLKVMKEKGYQIYLLSNISEDAVSYLTETQSFMELMDGKVYSYEEKINKPDPRIYQILLNRYQLKPEEVLYFDDLSSNIEQAKQLGMHGIVFKGRESIELAKSILEKGELC